MQPIVATRINIGGHSETVREIERLAATYFADLLPYRFESLMKAYDYVRGLPYIADPVGLETVSRPRYTLARDWNGPRDCDDKTVILLAAAKLLRTPARIVVCGQTSRPHHVYPEWFLGEWTPADATYPERSAFGQKLYRENYREVWSFEGQK